MSFTWTAHRFSGGALALDVANSVILRHDEGRSIDRFAADEQLERFRRREADPLKHWKITEEDWRNRRKWAEHNEAAEAMFEQTWTHYAPWTVIEANYKWYARLKFLRTTIRALESAGIKE